MLAFVLRRIVMTVPILFLVTIMAFSLIHLIPGDPATVVLGQEATPAAKVAFDHQLGLDKPLPVQYITWVGHALQGNLGVSLTDRTPVASEILQRLPVTLELTIGAFILALLFAVPLGFLAATLRGSIADYLGMIFAFGGLSIPSFWLGIMLIIFFAVHLQWLPASGYVPLFQDPRANLSAMILPMAATGLRESAVLMRMLRASMLEVLGQDYVRTARAKGLGRAVVMVQHVMRNALIPVVTTSGLTIAGLLGGVVITETIFHLPGFGSMIVQAINQRDFVTVQGAVLVSAVLIILVNLIVDLLYRVLDPRITL
jgi:peptide/nickel transport system permease protein